MTKDRDALLFHLDQLVSIHKRNGDIWVDFFESAREKILKDAAFGCEYLIMAWHGIGGYDETTTVKNEKDETARSVLHPKIYELASEIKNDRNKAA